MASNTHPMQYSTDPIGTITTNIIGLYNMLNRNLIMEYFAVFCAGGIIISIPISILFIIMQKFYVEGVASGSTKG